MYGAAIGGSTVFGCLLCAECSYDIVMVRKRCYLDPHDRITADRDESGLGRCSAGKESCRGLKDTGTLMKALDV